MTIFTPSHSSVVLSFGSGYVDHTLTLHYIHYGLCGFAILIVNESEVIDLLQLQYRHVRVPVEDLLHLLLRHIEREVPYEQSRHLFVIAYDIELVHISCFTPLYIRIRIYTVTRNMISLRQIYPMSTRFFYRILTEIITPFLLAIYSLEIK